MNQFCDKCGSQINQTTGTCPNCAPNYVVNNQPQVNKPENKKHTTKEVVAVVVAIALFSGLFGILGYVFGKVQNSLPKSYNEIVERYKLVIAGEKDDEKTLSNKLIDKVNEFDNYEICYSYIDINNDKTKELIIGGHVADEDVETYDIYTMDSDKNAVQILPVNDYDEDTEIEIYNEVIKVSEEETSHFEYLKLPENQWEVEKDEEYLYEDEKYFEVIEEEKNEISEETFKEADTKYEGEELDLEWVKVVLEEDKKEKETEPQVSKNDVYNELLKMYYTSISCGWSNLDGEIEGICDPDSANYMFYHNLNNQSLKDIGYIFIDIDNNGQDELIVSPIEESGSSTIYDMYTVVNDEIIRVIYSVERDAHFLAVDDTIINYGSGGAMLTSRINYYLEGSTGKLRIKEAVVYDGYTDPINPWFYATTEYYNLETYEQIPGILKPISETEAKNIEDNFPAKKEMQLTPFSLYKVQ